MAQRPERIENLVERSSLGDPGARRARSRVPDATARALLQRVQATQTSIAPTRTTTTSAARASAVARTGRFGQSRRARGTGGS